MEYFEAPIKKADDEKDDLAFMNKKEFRSNEEKWEKVEEVFQKAYENNSSSGVAPLFLAFQAEALTQRGKMAEAVALLRQVIALLSAVEIKDYYRGKLALLLIDTKSEGGVEEGVGILKQLALDDQGVAHDVALYHLGHYYWYMKKFAEARNYWNQLLIKYEKNEEYPSAWVPMAKEKLKLIDRDVE
jgi:tetratricopeptide (TPR) repeat protein